MCLGCHPYEYLFVDRTARVISLCYSFAELLWNVTSHEELTKSTTRFDNCGFKKNPILDQYLGENYKLQYVIPSKSLGGFIDFVDAIQIPFYEGYTIALVNEDKSQKICFSSSMYISCNCYFLYGISLFLLLVI